MQLDHKPEGKQISRDRRNDRRYPIELNLEYKLIRSERVLEAGTGRTVDLSSGGILFDAGRPLPIRAMNMDLTIAWPMLLHNVVPIRLFVRGRIVRIQCTHITIRITRHQFCTPARKGLRDTEPTQRTGPSATVSSSRLRF